MGRSLKYFYACATKCEGVTHPPEKTLLCALWWKQAVGLCPVLLLCPSGPRPALAHRVPTTLRSLESYGPQFSGLPLKEETNQHPHTQAQRDSTQHLNERQPSPFAGLKAWPRKTLSQTQPVPRRCLDFRKSPAGVPKRQGDHLPGLARTESFTRGHSWSTGMQQTCPSFVERKGARSRPS